MAINLPDYNNRTDPSKDYARLLYRNARGIQAAEHNEAFDMHIARIKSLGDTLYRDGSIVEGCEIGVDFDALTASLGAGKVYIDGEVRNIAAATVTIPPTGTVTVGIWRTEKVITELEDGGLRDPAVGTPNYQQPGAARLQVKTFWGLADETHPSGVFYPLHTIADGEVVKEKQVSQISQVSDVLARYDYDSNGNYITEGLTVRALAPEEAEKQTFSIAEGRAHVSGYEVVRSYAQRLLLDESPAVREVEGEEHIFNPDSEGKMRINVRHTPIEFVSMVKLTRQRTVTLTHGGFSGAADVLPDESVVAIVEARQGETVYEQGPDYGLINDSVNWSPAGNEPAPGSTYTVTYQYRTVVQPEQPDTTGFTVSNSVSGQLVQVRYSYRLPRIDILVLDRYGAVYQVLGVPHRSAPAAPSAPSGTLLLATILQQWEGLPTVVNNAIRAVPMNTLESMKRMLLDLYNLVARNKLEFETVLSAPTAARGLFVDNFEDDDMRDHGLAQEAAIVAGELMLPLDADITQAAENIVSTLDYTNEVLFDQPARSGSMKVNPYDAQEPLPARVTLDPAIDRWNIEETQWTSAITRAVTQTHGGSFADYTTTAATTETLTSSVAEASTMRSRDVSLHAEGFGADEGYVITFDGISVGTGSANAAGIVDAVFTVPAGLPTGTHKVILSGSGGSRGEAAYTATGTVTTTTKRNIVTVTTHHDPLAQTFTLDATRHVTGADIWLTKKGASEIRVQIRDVQMGFPGSSVFAEGRLSLGSMIEGTYNRVLFDNSALLQAGETYALVVLTDTSDHEVAIAELGKWDGAGGAWITKQAYQTGVLLSSSNAETWTPHQTMDLCFRLLGARFVNSKKTVSLGSVILESVTDLLPLAEIEYASAASEATFVLKQGAAEVARVQSGQTLSLAETLTGEYTLLVELTGETDLSPVLYSGLQLVQGKLRSSADYISRAFTCGTSKNVLVTLDTLQPGGSVVTVSLETAPGTWTEAESEGYSELGDGWREKKFSCPCNMPETRVKIVLTGGPAGRPRVRALRAVVIDA